MARRAARPGPGRGTPGVENGRCRDPFARRATAVAALTLLAAPGARAASITLDQAPVVLGRTESVGVTIEVDEPVGTEDRPLRLSANVGSFGPITRQASGRYRTVYIPPPTRFPQVALVAAWRETGADARIDFLRFALHGATQLAVSTRRAAEVTVEVGATTFGPVVADARGLASVTLVVPPDVKDAVITAKDRAGLTTTHTVAVRVPPYNRLTTARVPHAIVADGQSSARVEVYYDLGGADVPADRIRVAATLGAVAFERAEKGRYVYRYRPPSGTLAAEVRFTVSVDGDRAASAAVALRLGLPEAARVFLRPPDRALASDGRSSAPVTAVVLDDAGLGLPGKAVTLLANGRPLEPVTYRGAGTYEAPFVAPPIYPPGGLVQFTAQVTGGAGSSVIAAVNYQLAPVAVPRTLDARVSPVPVPADGRTEARVSLVVRDGAGRLLDGAQLLLAASEGTVSPVTPLGSGEYEATYVAPSRLPDADPLVRVVDGGGGFETSFAVPLRERPWRLLVGVHAGVSHSLGDQVGPRAGVDLWVPLHVGPALLAASLSASGGFATTKLPDATGTARTRADAPYFPFTLRLAYELRASRRLSAYAGLGGVAAFARARFESSGATEAQWGFGGLGFLAAALAVGPGHLFAELWGAWAPVQGRSFRLEAGGIGLDLGYRLGLLR